MNTQVKMIQRSESYALKDGMAVIRYVGMQFPQSQWASLSEEESNLNATTLDIGYVIMHSEGSISLLEAEQKLLSMVRQLGAHNVVIEFRHIENMASSESGSCNTCLRIYGRCQRIDIDSLILPACNVAESLEKGHS